MLLDTMETLCCLDGVTGGEDEVRDYILERVMPHADAIRTDPMGNLMVFKRGAKTPDRRVMLCAHMDEVGLIVTDITAEGYLRFDQAGGVNPQILLGKPVHVGAQRTRGVIGCKAVHLTTQEQRKTLPPMRDMYIDIGANSREEAEKSVSIGDLAAFDDTVVRYGDGFVKAKAIDDRAGCAAMIELLEGELPCDCWFAFTVQEEVGCRGASVAAVTVEPDVALILETTTAADLPGAEGAARVCELGKGVVIPFMDKGTIYDRELYNTLRRLADENGIAWQTKTMIAGGTDGSAVQRSLGGVRVAALSVAVRNIHSPASVAKLAECEAQLALARLFLEEMAK